MTVEQLYTQCLAQGAYYIESEGEAAIIDPLREYQPYLEIARKRGTRIRYIFETHFHADFVSGHVDLARETGATIVIGPTQVKTGYEAVVARDGQEFTLGNSTIRLIHTPGHTMESSCYLLIDEKGEERALFTGDTLFIGDVGRPDLAQHVVSELTPEKLAGHLYDSLRNKILPLSDHLAVYPGHGAGSACGKNMSKETVDTLGHQKRTNPALRPGLTREQFVKELLTGLTPPPGYFPKNVVMNIQGSGDLEEILRQGTKPLSPEEFQSLANQGKAIVLDTRKATVFGSGFIPGAVNVGLEGNFAPWVGTVLPDIHQEILLVTDEGKETDAVIRLARVGFNHSIGFLSGGMEAWKKQGFPVEIVQTLSAEDLANLADQESFLPILDVRRQSEYDSEHIPGALNIPLDYIPSCLSDIEKDKSKTWYVHCAGGYRSMIFISMLRKMGYSNLVNIGGGFSEMKASGRFQTTEYKEPITQL